MKTKSQDEILEKKLKLFNLYQVLMVVFLALAIISSTLAIVISLKFKNFKANLSADSPWISVVIQTKKMNTNDLDVPLDYQLNVEDYGDGSGKVDASWKGESLEDYLKSLPSIFTFNGGLMTGIKGSENDSSLKDYFWAFYSSTDPHTVDHPEQLAPVGTGDMLLQNVNVYYFSLSKIY